MDYPDLLNNKKRFLRIKSKLSSTKHSLRFKKFHLLKFRQHLESLLEDKEQIENNGEIVKEFNFHEYAINFCLFIDEPSNFRETDRQKLRYNLVQYLCSLLFLRHSCGKFPDISSYVSTLFQDMTQLMIKENEDTNVLIFKWFCKIFSEIPVLCKSEISSFLDKIRLGYSGLVKVENMCQLKPMNRDMWSEYEKESPETSINRDHIPDVITLLPKGLSSLRVWAEVPKFLFVLVNNYETSLDKEQNVTSLLSHELVSELMNFLMVDAFEAIKNHPNISDDAYEQYLRVQLQTFKLLLCLSNKENLEMKCLISGFLSIFENCPNRAVMLRLELVQTFNMLLHSSLGPSGFINIIVEVSENWDEGNLEFAISLFAAKVYDTYLSYRLQTKICGLLPTLLQKYIQKVQDINKISDMLLKLINAYSLKLKAFEKVERPISEWFIGDKLDKSTLSKESPASVHAEKINLPNRLIGTDSTKLLQSIVSGTLSATRSVKNVGNGKVFWVDFNNTYHLIPVYTKFFKHFVSITRILRHTPQVDLQHNYLLFKEVKVVIVNFAIIFSILPSYMTRRIFYRCFNICNIEELFEISNFSIFANAVLSMKTSARKEFISVLLNFFFKTFYTLDMAENAQNVYRVHLYYFENVLQFTNADEKELEAIHTDCLTMILKTSREMLEIKTENTVRLFYLNVLILLFKHTQKFKSIYSIPSPKLLSIILSLKKHYESTKSVHFQNKVLELFLTLFENYPKEAKLIMLSALMEPTIKALKATTPLVLKALKNLDSMKIFTDSLLLYYIYPLRNELFEGLKNALSLDIKNVKEIALSLQVRLRDILYDCENQFEFERPSVFCIKLNCKSLSPYPIEFAPMEKVLKSALNSVFNDIVCINDEHRSLCFALAQGYLAFNVEINIKDIDLNMKQLTNIDTLHKTKIRLCSNQPAREAHKAILTLMLACAPKESIFVEGCLLHYVLLALCEQVQHTKKDGKVDEKTKSKSNEIDHEPMEVEDSDAEFSAKDSNGNKAKSMDVVCDKVALKPISMEANQLDAVDIKTMDPFIIVDAIVDFIASGSNVIQGVDALRWIVEYSYSILGSNLLEFNLFRYYIKKMCYLCYEQSNSLQFSGCIMMEALLQDHYQVLENTQERIIDKKSFCSKVLTEDLLSKCVHALLYVIGSKESSTTECFNSAKSNLENMCSLFKVDKDIKEKPFITILKIFVVEMFSPNQYIKEQMRLCLNKIAQSMKRNLFDVTNPHLPKNFELEDFFHSSSFSSKIDASKDLQFLRLLEFYFDPDDLESKKKMFDVLKRYCELISSDNEYRNTSADKITLYKEALSTLSRLYFKISVENREFVIQVLKRNLKSSLPEVSNLAFSCVKSIHSVWKEKNLEQGSIPPIFQLLDDDLDKLKAVTIWHYWFIIIMFADYLPTDYYLEFRMFLTKFSGYFVSYCMRLFSKMSIIKMWELYNGVMENLKNVFRIPSTKLHLPSCQMAVLLLNVIQKCEEKLRMGHGNFVFNLAIPVLKYFPAVSQKYFLYDEHEERSFACFFDFILKYSKKVDFLVYVEKYMTETIFSNPETYLNMGSTKQSNLCELWTLKKFLNLLYCLCKKQENFRDKLVLKSKLVSILRDIWNDEKFQFWHISPETKEFTNFQVYKQLAYILLEVFKHTEEIKLLFELLKAPIEHFSEGFYFLTSYLHSNEKIAENFLELIIEYVDGTNPKNRVPKADLTRIPLTISVKILKEDAQIQFPKSYPDDLQIKIWRFILLPFFKIFCKKDICKDKLSEIHYYFVKRLAYYKCDEVSEDLSACLVEFSCLLLKHCSPANEQYKNIWWKFAESISDKDTYFTPPFCSAMKYFGSLLSCYLHLVTNEDKKYIISEVTNILMHTNTPEIIIESLLLIPAIFESSQKVPPKVINDFVTSMIRASRILHKSEIVPDIKQFMINTITSFQEFCRKKTGSTSYVLKLFALADNLANFLQEINVNESSTIALATPVPPVTNLLQSPNHGLTFVLSWENLSRKTYFLDCIEIAILDAKGNNFISSESISSHALPSITLLNDESAIQKPQPLVQELVEIEREFQTMLCQLNRTEFFFNAFLKHCQLDQSLAENIWQYWFPKVLRHNLVSVSFTSFKSFFENKVTACGDEPLPRSYVMYAEILLQCIPLAFFSKFFDVLQCLMKVPSLARFICLQLEEILFSETNNADQNANEEGIKYQLAEGYLERKEDDLSYGFYKNYCTSPEIYVGFSYFYSGLFQKACNKISEVDPSSLPGGGFEAQTLETLFSRCAVEMSKWDFLTENKFLVCEKVLENGSNQNSSCECLQAINEEDELGKIFFRLCPSQIISPTCRRQFSIELQKIYCRLINELKKIPIILSAEYIELLQNAARVYEFQKTFCRIKSILESKDENNLDCTTNDMKILSTQIPSDNLFHQDICAAHLRFSSLFLAKVEHLNLRSKKCVALKSYGQILVNKCFIKLAAQSLKRGDSDSYMKYHYSLKLSHSSSDVIKLYTEMVLLTQNDIQDSNNREELLKKMFIHLKILSEELETFPDEQPTLLQANCKAYVGLLESHFDAESATDTFEESVNIEEVAKNQEFYGNHLEKMFISAEPKERQMGSALKSIGLLFNSCKYKDNIEAQIPLAKILGLLSYDVGSEMEKLVAERALDIPTEYWLPLLPQLVEIISNKKDHILFLLQSIGEKYLQSVFFAFKGFTAFPKKISSQLEKTINRLKRSNPSLLSTLENISLELLHLKNNFHDHDDILVKLKASEATICDLAFEVSAKCACSSKLTELAPYLNLCTSIFKKRLAKEIENIKSICPNEWEEKVDRTKQIPLKKIKNINMFWVVLLEHLERLSDIIKFHEKKVFRIKSLNKYYRFSAVHFDKLELKMFDNNLMQLGENSVKILRFLPRLEIVQKHNTHACRISIKGTDGKEYNYLVVPESCMSYNGHETKVTQLFSFLNVMLKKDRGASRLLKYNLPVVISFPSLELVKDNKGVFSYFEIFEKRIIAAKQNLFLEYFYALGKSNLYQNTALRCAFFRKVERVVPRTIFKTWAKIHYISASDYWMFRKKFSGEVGLLNFTKYCFLLTFLSPESIYIHERTGEVTAFGLNFTKQNSPTNILEKLISEHAQLNWPPFQLTPNIQEFLTPCGIEGSVVITMGVAARCFRKNLQDIESLLNILIPKLSDFEEINLDMNEYQKKIHMHIDKISTLIKDSAEYGTYGKIHELIKDSIQLENMSLMNPLSHPWL